MGSCVRETGGMNTQSSVLHFKLFSDLLDQDLFTQSWMYTPCDQLLTNAEDRMPGGGRWNKTAKRRKTERERKSKQTEWCVAGRGRQEGLWTRTWRHTLALTDPHQHPWQSHTLGWQTLASPPRVQLTTQYFISRNQFCARAVIFSSCTHWLSLHRLSDRYSCPETEFCNGGTRQYPARDDVKNNRATKVRRMAWQTSRPATVVFRTGFKIVHSTVKFSRVLINRLDLRFGKMESFCWRVWSHPMLLGGREKKLQNSSHFFSPLLITSLLFTRVMHSHTHTHFHALWPQEQAWRLVLMLSDNKNKCVSTRLYPRCCRH